MISPTIISAVTHTTAQVRCSLRSWLTPRKSVCVAQVRSPKPVAGSAFKSLMLNSLPLYLPENNASSMGLLVRHSNGLSCPDETLIRPTTHPEPRSGGAEHGGRSHQRPDAAPRRSLHQRLSDDSRLSRP